MLLGLRPLLGVKARGAAMSDTAQGSGQRWVALTAGLLFGGAVAAATFAATRYLYLRDLDDRSQPRRGRSKRSPPPQISDANCLKCLFCRHPESHNTVSTMSHISNISNLRTIPGCDSIVVKGGAGCTAAPHYGDATVQVHDSQQAAPKVRKPARRVPGPQPAKRDPRRGGADGTGSQLGVP